MTFIVSSNFYTPELNFTRDSNFDSGSSYDATTTFANNSVLMTGTLTDTQPVAESPEALTSGYMASSFFTDFYNRLHVNPASLSLGNLLSGQTREIRIFNAYLTTKQLDNVLVNNLDGASIIVNDPLPFDFTPLLEKAYSVEVSGTGSPTINGSILFDFSDQDVIVPVTGQRVVVWPYIPEVNHTEQLEWETDIIVTPNLEQRISLREAPRQQFKYTCQLTEQQFSKAKALSNEWAHRVYGVPIWSELDFIGALSSGATQVLVDTANKDYRGGGTILLWESDTNSVAVEIDNVLSDRVELKLPLEQSFTNAYIMPLRFGRTLRGSIFRREATDVIINENTFSVIDNTTLSGTLPYDTYRSKTVLHERTILNGGLTEGVERAVDIFDNVTGTINVIASTNFVSKKGEITQDTLDLPNRWDTRLFLHSLRGRQKGFWLPTWNKDLILIDDVANTSASMTVANINYNLYYDTTDVMILLKDGTRVYTRVTSGTVNGDGNEDLSLSAAIGTDIVVSQVELICFLDHVRLNTDKVQLNHTYDGRAYLKAQVVTTPE